MAESKTHSQARQVRFVCGASTDFGSPPLRQCHHQTDFRPLRSFYNWVGHLVVIIVTHDLAVACSYSHRLMVMRDPPEPYQQLLVSLVFRV